MHGIITATVLDSSSPFLKVSQCLLSRAEARKRKASPNKAEATNGPSAKKAKTSTESSSSEESSSEDEVAVKPAKATPTGSVSINDKSAGIHALYHLFTMKHKHNQNSLIFGLATKVAPAKAAAPAAAASSSSDDSSDSEEEKKPAKAPAKVGGKHAS